MFKIYKINYSTLNTHAIVERLHNTNEKINRKIKGTIFEKMVKYCKLVIKDYKEVVINTRTDIKEKPLKATVYFTGIGVLTYCATHNPDMQHFRAKYVQCANNVAIVSPTIVNPTSVQHLKHLEQSFNGDLVRHINLGVLSIIWIDKFSKDCKIYEYTCPYLQVSYREMLDRIVDVGFLNVWWNISRKMLDYDINY